MDGIRERFSAEKPAKAGLSHGLMNNSRHTRAYQSLGFAKNVSPLALLARTTRSHASHEMNHRLAF
jgi:hypothetical protein